MLSQFDAETRPPVTLVAGLPCSRTACVGLGVAGGLGRAHSRCRPGTRRAVGEGLRGALRSVLCRATRRGEERKDGQLGVRY